MKMLMRLFRSLRTTQKGWLNFAESPVITDPMHIDDRVRMAANARRYEWLRDGALSTGSANVPMVRIGVGDPIGGKALDSAVDAAATDWPVVDDWPWGPYLKETCRSGENTQEQQQ
ncbi:hypothetical protein [Pseudomonas chlororaphis]|uniref:hypothetical protein n=1 Tax=Pseudomonas chlororaphis TaxID=587753 RepID=UPI002407E762|nr:hypothetical protein [Pseudomonas chlororaphis]